MMKHGKRFLYVILGVLSATALVLPTAAMAQSTITVAGSSTVKPIVQAAAAVFSRAHGVKFSIKGGGSSVGVKSAGTGATDIGDASRDIHAKEMAKWPTLVPHTVGRDGVTMILHKDLGIKDITKEQIQKIYMGEITDWNELGGPDEPIILIDKEEGRSTLELFLNFAGIEGKEIDGGKHMIHARNGSDKWSTAKARIIGSNQQALVQVANKRGAIGYVSVGDAVAFAARTHKIVLPNVDGVAATVANVKNSTFPITRPLNVITKGEATGAVKDFIDFLLSPKGQAIVAKKNFVPVK
jgi:phosphate transport system substrate-binding protein